MYRKQNAAVNEKEVEKFLKDIAKIKACR